MTPSSPTRRSSVLRAFHALDTANVGRLPDTPRAGGVIGGDKIARAPDRARERAGGVIGLGDGLGNLEQHRLACMRFGDAKEGFERGDRGGAIGAGRDRKSTRLNSSH